MGQKGAWQDQAAWEHNIDNATSHELVRDIFQQEQSLKLDLSLLNNSAGVLALESKGAIWKELTLGFDLVDLWQNFGPATWTL